MPDIIRVITLVVNGCLDDICAEVRSWRKWNQNKVWYFWGGRANSEQFLAICAIFEAIQLPRQNNHFEGFSQP